jgi:hypothetical protein
MVVRAVLVTARVGAAAALGFLVGLAGGCVVGLVALGMILAAGGEGGTALTWLGRCVTSGALAGLITGGFAAVFGAPIRLTFRRNRRAGGTGVGDNREVRGG